MTPNKAAGRPKKKILIVDDEEDLVEMLSLRLESTGQFEVERALNGLIALQKAATFLPEVVLLDSVMPGLNGWEVCRRLRQDPRTQDIPIVIMTAGTPDQAKERLRENGADHIIFKPYEYGDLLKVLATIKRGKGLPRKAA